MEIICMKRGELECERERKRDGRVYVCDDVAIKRVQRRRHQR
jgi:hypothetical protein